MNLRSLGALGALILVPTITVPNGASAAGCSGNESALVIRGDDFKSVPIQIRPGGVRIGGVDLNYLGEEGGWSVSRPATSESAPAPTVPATQITVNKDTIEIRSLDRKTDSFDDSPDAVLTAVAGETGTEVRVNAKGDAMLEVSGQSRAPASKELAVGCSGISLFVSLRVL